MLRLLKFYAVTLLRSVGLYPRYWRDGAEGAEDGVPIAWAVVDEHGIWFTRVREEDAVESFRRAVAFGEHTGRIVPLYRDSLANRADASPRMQA